VPGYGQYCPIALAAEVFAERWTPIIVRNLMMGCERFGEILDGAPGLPRSVLSQRLRRLERDGVVERRDGRYALTESGRELADVCMTLGIWGARWREVRPEHHDPYLVLWSVSRLVDPATLPRPRVVVRFDLTDRSRPDRYWLVLGSAGSEVCVQEPGYPADGVVSTDAAWLVRWVTGAASVGQAQRAGAMAVAGPRWLVRELAAWGRLSAFADVQPVARAAAPAG
jgi:DNA-binding HxlR family transcriptional regulator